MPKRVRRGTSLDKRRRVRPNEALVRRRFAELDKGNFAVFDELFDKRYVLHFPGMPITMKLEATKQFYRALYSSFPDLKHTILEQISAGDEVVTRWTARGTHRADWMGIAATGKSITLSGINIYTVTRGKLSKSHVNWDVYGLMEQLGATSIHLHVPKNA